MWWVGGRTRLINEIIFKSSAHLIKAPRSSECYLSVSPAVCPSVRWPLPLRPLCVICFVLSLDLIRPLPTRRLPQPALRSAFAKWSIPKCCPPTNRCHNNAPEVRRTQDAMANGRNDSASCRNCCRLPHASACFWSWSWSSPYSCCCCSLFASLSVYCGVCCCRYCPLLFLELTYNLWLHLMGAHVPLASSSTSQF